MMDLEQFNAEEQGNAVAATFSLYHPALSKIP
jgi:hypothetical protein